jgi:hypothetical protein
MGRPRHRIDLCGELEIHWASTVMRRNQCDNPPRKIPYYRLRPIHFGH